MWLALETATRTTSVALLQDDVVLASVDDDSGRPHSERLLSAIEELLAEAGVEKPAIEAYAVSVGPGSFTGLRIGVATAQGFALVDGRPAVAVPTLAALALAAGGKPAAALLDARRGEVYAAGYADPMGGQADLLPEGLYRPEALAEGLPPEAGLVGTPGCEPFLETLAGLRPDLRVQVAPCRAERVGALAAGMSRIVPPGRAEALVPRYVRRAEAEVKRTGLATESSPD